VHAFDVDSVGHEALDRLVVDDTHWDRHQSASDLALTPAACYALYPIFAGVLPAHGRIVDVESWCYRHEPSSDPARLRAFRMRELVCAGQPAAVVAWRDAWIERGTALLRSLGLEPAVVPASDPFFGRVGRLMEANQRAQSLKFELVVPVASDTQGTAVMSCNYHREHFGEAFRIRTLNQDVAHTACVAFGIERLALALLRAHGFDPCEWPACIRAELS
jgi:seryl-tRNA synthetase